MLSVKQFYDISKGVEEDRNFLVLENHVVKDCFKGSPDENNNGLFLTYDFHKQKFTPNPIGTNVILVSFPNF